jgi:hypothetical protein
MPSPVNQPNSWQAGHNPYSPTVPPELLTAAAAVAAAAAVERLRVLGWSTDEIIGAADVLPVIETHLLYRVREAMRLAMPQAVEDYREAMAVRMPRLAVQTFTASAVLAGIDAANGYHQAQRPARVEHPTDPDGIALHLPDAPAIGIDV